MTAPAVAALVVLVLTAVLAVRQRVAGWQLGSLVLAGALLATALVMVPAHWPAAHWMGGAAIGLASAVVSFLLVLGGARRVLRASGVLPSALGHLAASRAGQLVLHPATGAVVNTALLIWLFTSGWYDTAAGGGLQWVALVLLSLAGGLWGCVALLDDELVPMGPGPRLLFTVLVSALNQLPGVMVINTGHVMQGGAMWLIAAPMVIPLLFAGVHAWMEHDRARARQVDAELDAWERQRRLR